MMIEIYVALAIIIFILCMLSRQIGQVAQGINARFFSVDVLIQNVMREVQHVGRERDDDLELIEAEKLPIQDQPFFHDQLVVFSPRGIIPAVSFIAHFKHIEFEDRTPFVVVVPDGGESMRIDLRDIDLTNAGPEVCDAFIAVKQDRVLAPMHTNTEATGSAEHRDAANDKHCIKCVVKVLAEPEWSNETTECIADIMSNHGYAIPGFNDTPSKDETGLE